MRCIGVRVKGVAGRDTIIHKRQRKYCSHKELVASHFPLFFKGFEAQLLRNSCAIDQHNSTTITQLLRPFQRPLLLCPHTPP